MTFVLSDVVGSTRLWDGAPDAMSAALARHDELIAEAVSTRGGVLLKSRGEGDSTFSVFARATDAISAAQQARAALAAEPWPTEAPLRVRFAVHTGEAIERDDDYFGPAVNRVARLRAIAQADQVLVSGGTAQLVVDHLPDGVTLRLLGEITLRDLSRPEVFYELETGDTPARGDKEGPLRYRVLGPLELRCASGAVPLGSDRQRRLLAQLLVVANRPVTAERLADELWDEHPPSNPRVALRTQVARLRKRLDTNDLLTEDAGYRLRVAAGELDAERFEDLVRRAGAVEPYEALRLLDRALELWRGPAYEEFSHRPFARAEALRLDELRIAAREQRAEALLALERAGDAVADLEALLTEAPERERPRALIMHALYRSGRHTEALAVYQQWRRYLAEELGLEPSPELQRLEQQILQHDVAPEVPSTPWQPIPRPVTSFVGRRDDLVRIDEALWHDRLVVLCGPGGVGKTRLAVEVGHRVAARYPHGLAFCDLSSVARGADVVRVIATAVGLEERGGRQLDDQLVAYLRDRRSLLLVDNCEHVAAATARVVARIIEYTAATDVLATTREPLAVSGEQLLTIDPLSTEGADSPAATLFVDRARSVGSDFGELGGLDEVPAICKRLDGLPLAIELAAARVRSLSLRDLARGLDDRFEFLVGAHHADDRHGSMRAVLDWSYGLLSEDEQRAFDQLAVFASWFDLDAARAVVGAVTGQAGATAALLRLVDCSLVVTRHDDEVTTYSLLDSMRHYGLERLSARRELTVARDRHASWAVELAEATAPMLAGGSEGTWASRVTRHFAELRAAQEWLIGRDITAASRLVSALRPYAMWRRNTEVGSWAGVVASVAAGSPTDLLPSVLLCAFIGAWQRGDYEAAEEYARTAVDSVRPRDPTEVLYVVDAIADVAFFGGDTDRAAALHRRASDLAIDSGDLLQAMWTLGSVSHALLYGGALEASRRAAEETAALAERCGGPTALAMREWVLGELEASTDLAAAEAHLEAAIALSASVGSRQIVVEAEYGLAIVKARRGDLMGALEHFEALLADTHDTRTGILPRDLVRIIEVLIAAKGHEQAALLCGAATSPRRSARRFPVAEAALQAALGEVRHILGDEELQRLMVEGADLDEAAIVAVALDAIQQVTRK